MLALPYLTPAAVPTHTRFTCFIFAAGSFGASMMHNDLFVAFATGILGGLGWFIGLHVLPAAMRWLRQHGWRRD